LVNVYVLDHRIFWIYYVQNIDHDSKIFSFFVNVIEKNLMKMMMMNDDDVFYDDVFSMDFDLELISFFLVLFDLVSSSEFLVVDFEIDLLLSCFTDVG